MQSSRHFARARSFSSSIVAHRYRRRNPLFLFEHRFSTTPRWLHEHTDPLTTPPSLSASKPRKEDKDDSSLRNSSSASSATVEDETGLSSALKRHMQNLADQAAIRTRTHAEEFTASAKSTFSRLGFHLNKMTGYDEIEALKLKVARQEEIINKTRETAREAKKAYELAVQDRSNSQREVNELLHRKSSWTDADVLRFTEIVRQDHSIEQSLLRAKADVKASDEAVEAEFSTLMRLILGRYHEEQVWSDKIRSASTYGQLTALGLNLFVFVLAIVLVEPWKRKRLAGTFEKKVDEMGVKGEKTVEEAVRTVTQELDQRLTVLKQELKMELALSSTQEEKAVDLVAEVIQVVEEMEQTRMIPLVLCDLHERTSGLLPDVDAKTEVGIAMASSAALALTVGWIARSYWL